MTQQTKARRVNRILIGLSLAVALLTGTTGFLLVKNRSYREANRDLIIQNDSVMSANIELSRALSNTEGVKKEGQLARIKRRSLK